MVPAAVTEFQLIGFCPVRQREYLMAQADTKDRKASMQLPDGFDYLGYILRIAGTVAKEQPVRIQFEDILYICVPWQHGHVTSPFNQ